MHFSSTRPTERNEQIPHTSKINQCYWQTLSAGIKPLHAFECWAEVYSKGNWHVFLVRGRVGYICLAAKILLQWPVVRCSISESALYVFTKTFCIKFSYRFLFGDFFSRQLGCHHPSVLLRRADKKCFCCVHWARNILFLFSNIFAEIYEKYNFL